MLLFTSPLLDQKYHSGENFFQTLKFNCFKWNLVPRPIPPCKVQWRCIAFLFSTRNPLFGQICSKKPKLSVETELLHLKLLEEPEFNSGVHFFCFWVEVRILSKFGSKIKNCFFKVKFGTWTRSSIQNSMVNFTFLFLTEITLFNQIWSQKSKFFVYSEIWFIG